MGLVNRCGQLSQSFAKLGNQVNTDVKLLERIRRGARKARLHQNRDCASGNCFSEVIEAAGVLTGERAENVSGFDQFRTLSKADNF